MVPKVFCPSPTSGFRFRLSIHDRVKYKKYDTMLIILFLMVLCRAVTRRPTVLRTDTG